MTTTVEVNRLSANRLKDLENLLFSLARTQSRRQTPADLPSPLFWDQLTQLVQHIEVELEEAMRRDGWGGKTQMLQRRQGNVRRTIAELTRNRLNAFVRHATTTRLLGSDEASSAAASIDWTRHTPAERVFHDGVVRLVDRYKSDIDWRLLQSGLVASQASQPLPPAGFAPLDRFADSGATSSPPTATPEVGRPADTDPSVTIHSTMPADAAAPGEPPAEWDDDDFDFEPEPFEKAGAVVAVEETKPVAAEAPVEGVEDGGGATSVTEGAEAESAEAAAGAADEEEAAVASSDLLRILILKDLDEPLIDEDGAEIELRAGDVHQCAALLAETLISAGFAEAAPL